LSSLFSSPGKSAQEATSGQQAAVGQEQGQLENYVGGQELDLRKAIAGIPLNPQNDVAFGNQGPGTQFGTGSVTPGANAPPQYQPKPAPPPPGGPPPPQPGPPQPRKPL
jgi:hypothetical protein